MNRYSPAERQRKKIEDDFEEFIQRYREAIMQAGEEIYMNIIGLKALILGV